MPKPPPDPDRVATIVAVALSVGDKAACAQFRISARTLSNYKKRVANIADVAHKFTEKRQTLAVGAWLEKAKEARAFLLTRVKSLAEKSDDLHAVTGAYKIVNDGILAEQVVSEGDEDGGRAESGSGMAGAGEATSEATRGAGSGYVQ